MVGIALGGVVFNLIPLLVDRGLGAAEAAKLFGLYGLCVIFGRLLSGWLLDKFWAPAVGFVLLLAPTCATLMLGSGVHTIAAIATAICLMGVAGGAEFDLIAYLTGRYFGRRNFAALYAGQYAIFGATSGIAPALYGAFHDATGSYAVVMWISSGLFLSAGAALLLLGRYPDFDRSAT
jgi:OFA family oxalate/formate antiporter-like MFS transporter